MRQILQIVSIATGSFLAFAMEPLVGRTLLAAFGGIAAVWVTCLVAFQVLLVGGYFYAHASFARPTRGRLMTHVAVLMAAAVWCVFVSGHDEELMAVSSFAGMPAIKTLIAVFLVAGLPFVVLSANSSLVQVLAGGDYRLYAVGNIGSLLGLAAYPFLLEPYMSLEMQWILLGVGIVAYALLIGVLSLLKRDISGMATPSEHVEDGACARGGEAGWLLWFSLSAASCFLLNAVTAHLTGNVAPIPLLWAGLLAIYLISYIIGFSAVGSRLEALWAVIAAAGCIGCGIVFRMGNDAQGIFLRNLCVAGGTLLFGATAIHARLYNLRPRAKKLTGYYLAIALGGAAGGIASGIACPAFSTFIVEYPAALVATFGVSLWVIRDGLVQLGKIDKSVASLAENKRLFKGLFVAAAVYLGFVMCAPESGLLARGRSFYGTWRVKQETVTNSFGKRFGVYEFFHNGTIHGLEAIDPLYRDGPTAYFGEKAGGLSFTTHPAYGVRGLRSGVIGLGVGILAWYEREQDEMDFFEICPEVIKVATSSRHFDFWTAKKGKGEIVCGDARKILERQHAEGAPKYDVLVVDAYSGDSIPYHLITSEALKLYCDRLEESGTLALHITNWNIDLFPIVKAAAKELGMNAEIIACNGGNFTIYSTWAFLSRKPLAFPDGVPRLDMASVREVELPHDRKGSLIDYIKWKQ